MYIHVHISYKYKIKLYGIIVDGGEILWVYVIMLQTQNLSLIRRVFIKGSTVSLNTYNDRSHPHLVPKLLETVNQQIKWAI